MALLKQEQVINMLKFDMQGLTNEILNKLQKEIAVAFLAWEDEVKSKTTHGLFGGGVRPYIASTLKREGNMLIGYLKANTYVLAESYGTGSFMLDDNPGLKDYIDSKLYNPLRRGRGKAIRGRSAGKYTNLFGQERSTSGAFAGINIEGKKVYTRKKETERDYFISPTRPSYAIQLATNWLYKTYLPKAYQLAVREINFAKYLIES